MSFLALDLRNYEQTSVSDLRAIQTLEVPQTSPEVPRTSPEVHQTSPEVSSAKSTHVVKNGVGKSTLQKEGPDNWGMGGPSKGQFGPDPHLGGGPRALGATTANYRGRADGVGCVIAQAFF